MSKKTMPEVTASLSSSIANLKKSMAMNKILVAVDGSENGDRAARTAINFAKDYSAQT